ncbi:hypothetical protein BJ085DRAFT_36399 [Dimargaris cristalligena]|uniref:Uncharacterized protein n=1 Tax=Dimargaris cristalligena TaxID=215637 RepID=A0A4P9ZP46_9FUNG|nr:hypothetical protein BJ085DRAFT_36399 [Dimargaris cristalligena]|eukprot:RKP34322.1 hypothetical protein BJ085DRAFT_36399 [Dimargaris cristalligena]
MENREFENARLLLAKARERANTAAIWMKSVLLERITEKPQVALQLLDTALTRFPTFAKLWMMQGQIYEALGQSERALESYRRGTSQCPTSVPLWLLFARLEEHRGVPVRARALLERGRLLNPQSADLWLDAIRLEARQSGPTAAATRLVVSKALQECPSAGQLWAEAIFLEPRPQRKTRSVDAMKKCHDDPHLMAAIARLFWSERKNDKARVWFQRAAQLNGDIGDTWAWWYKFESEQGTPDNADQVRVACAKAEPHHGDHWQPVAKDIANFGKPVSDILQMVADTLTL